jgi:hypothetical protein
MTDYLATVTPKTEAAANEATRALLTRDTKEALDFYPAHFARLMGIKPLEDMNKNERLAFYVMRPPILADGLPPDDEDGVWPRWYQLAAQDQAYYEDCVRDYISLIRAKLDEAPQAT